MAFDQGNFLTGLGATSTVVPITGITIYSFTKTGETTPTAILSKTDPNLRILIDQAGPDGFLDALKAGTTDTATHEVLDLIKADTNGIKAALHNAAVNDETVLKGLSDLANAGAANNGAFGMQDLKDVLTGKYGAPGKATLKA